MALILLLWLGIAIVIGVGAKGRGRSGFGWFLLAIFLSPLVAGLLLVVLPDLRLRELLSRRASTSP
jgi:peptidoglycan/LPS O-acetylase OafA/YrhL